jgi:DNA ligase D-like protein (predicted ligase)
MGRDSAVPSDLLQSLSAEAQGQLEQRPFPDRIDPMLAELSHQVFSDPDWIFERKLDGERCVAFRQGDQVKLHSRNHQSLNATYPEIVSALAQQPLDCFVVDGEIVAFEGKVTSFSRLQQRMQIDDAETAWQSGVTVYYYLFDLLYLDGWDVMAVPLRDRKQLLKRTLDFQDPLRLRSHRNESGADYYKEACRNHWEGLIAKDARSPYRQTRSSAWQKFKCSNRQEFVIGGYTDPEGERIGFGAILIGYYQLGNLRYAGKVGTGFDDDTLHRLHQQFQSLKQAKSPFAINEMSRKGVHWLAPKLVAQIEFSEWTEDSKLRHPRFLGLRRDKAPNDITLEQTP